MKDLYLIIGSMLGGCALGIINHLMGIDFSMGFIGTGITYLVIKMIFIELDL